eukprot:m.35061 g.35061  ORF g.35061 m.35061 type:complete len:64 (+) comp12365_c0_seq1:684-875(+)
MGSALYTDTSGSLLDSFHGILNLMDTTLGAPGDNITIVLVAKHGGNSRAESSSASLWFQYPCK